MKNRLVVWLVLVPLCALLVLFALANRQLVLVNFNPFAPVETLSAPGFGVPLFVVIYLVLLVGVLLGGVATWFAQAEQRRAKRHWRKEAEHLRLELEAARRSGVPLRRPAGELDDAFD